MTTDVRYQATQRAGLRGVGFEFGLFVIYLVFAPVLSRSPGGLAVWVAVAAGAASLRLALFSGPHHRGVEVTSTQVRAGRIALPLADVVGVEATDRRELRRRTLADEVVQESVPPGPREAVVVSLASPEGHDYAFGMAVDDAVSLREAIERSRDGAGRTTDGVALEPLPLVARQGADRRIAGWVVAVAIGFDVLWVVFNGWYLGVTVVALLVVLRSARRRIVVDQERLVTGRLEVRWSDVERARIAPVDEARLVPRGRTVMPLWAPPWTLIVVLRSPAGASVARRTLLAGLPRPVDLAPTGAAGDR